MRSTRSVSLPLGGDGTLRRLVKRNLGALTGLALLAVAAAIAASLATWAAVMTVRLWKKASASSKR